MLKITKIKPLFTSLITTADQYEKDEKERGLIVAKRGEFKPYQTVVAVGSSVRDIKPGDKVMLELSHFEVKKYKEGSIKNDIQSMDQIIGYRIPSIMINNTKHFFIQDRDVQMVFEGEEVEEEESPVIHPSQQIITEV